MKCFEQDDFIIIEETLSTAIFAIDDIIDFVYADTDNKMELIRELTKARRILETQKEKDQNGDFD